MKKVNVADLKITPSNVLFAWTSPTDYEMSRVLLIELESYDKYVILEASHCSCYGFEDVEWEAFEFTSEELTRLGEGKLKSDGLYLHANCEKKLYEFINENL